MLDPPFIDWEIANINDKPSIEDGTYFILLSLLPWLFDEHWIYDLGTASTCSPLLTPLYSCGPPIDSTEAAIEGLVDGASD
jgi:hypothetical protein